MDRTALTVLLGILALAVLLDAPGALGQGLAQPWPEPRRMSGEIPNTFRPAALLSWEGVLEQVQRADRRARHTPIVVEGNLTLNADGSITVTRLSGTLRFDQPTWHAEENPLARILEWRGDRFHLRLGQHTTILIRGTNLPGVKAAEGWGLAIRASLTYEGVGAFIVHVASRAEYRGILVEGEAKGARPDGQLVPTGKPVSVLATRAGDGLAVVTNGRIAVRGEGQRPGPFQPIVQGFLYAQGYRDGEGRPRGIDVLGGTVQGMAVSSRVALWALQEADGRVSDQVIINSVPASLTIPPQMPGGRRVYLGTLSYTAGNP